MEKQLRAQPNQTLLDMILTEYGTLEAGISVAATNNIDLSNIPVTGSVRRMPPVTTDKIDLGEAGYLRRNNITIGTLSQTVLGFEIVLKPAMHLVPNISGDPHVLGLYSFDLIGSAGFIHTNPLDVGYISDNKVRYQTEERYLSGEPDETAIPIVATTMAALSIPYVLPWTVGLGYMMVWCDTLQPVVTATFKDIEGNKAFYAPLVVLDNVDQGAIAQFMGELAIDIITATPSSAKLRVRRSHPLIGLANFSTHAMEWLGEASMGIPDPADPLNTDKVILNLGAGVHTIGLKTTYYYPGGTPAYPSSAFSMVIKVI